MDRLFIESISHDFQSFSFSNSHCNIDPFDDFFNSSRFCERVSLAGKTNLFDNILINRRLITKSGINHSINHCCHDDRDSSLEREGLRICNLFITRGRNR